jgi:uncharacterized flavoprotein (TIGR03862 family)
MMDAIVIGAGPAGLMAAEALSAAGWRVLVAEAKPSPARKLLMAGKSGLNLTKDEPFDRFLAAYTEAAPRLDPILRAFDNSAVVDWANALDQPTFTGSTGRVFPKAMKASPLVRAWMARLSAQGVTLRTRWRWMGWVGDALDFTTPDGRQTLTAPVTILATGGASWPRLGSDGGWTAALDGKGVGIAPFQPANVGVSVNWSPHMAKQFGRPVKAAALIVGDTSTRGEFIISGKGLEGGGVYAVSRALREGAPLALDLVPDLAEDAVTARLSSRKQGTTLANHLRKALNLDPARLALLQEFARPLPDDPAILARLIKHLPVPHAGLRPLAEAISTAGGLRLDALDDTLMLKTLPGTFAAGEMLDWEAPTGGYLLTACLATGLWAGRHASAWLSARPPASMPDAR